MAASLKDKRTPITTPPYQVPSVDVTLDPPTFSLDTTFKNEKMLTGTALQHFKKILFSFGTRPKIRFVHDKYGQDLNLYHQRISLFSAAF
jgi:hypothetical protein